MQILEKSESKLAPGAKEFQYTILDKNKKRQKIFVIQVEKNHPQIELKLGLPHNGFDFGLTTVMEQALSASKIKHEVIASINGDFYNMTNGTPVGLTIKNGKILNKGNRNAIGFKSDGSVIMGNPLDGESISDKWKDVSEAVGAWHLLVKDGIKQEIEKNTFSNTPAPRTAVGVIHDGTIIFVVIDGRNRGYSEGVTIDELADIMVHFNCVNAINLDGGGSSTFVTRDYGSNKLSVKNRPCDGEERKVANSLLIVSTHDVKEPVTLAVLPKNSIILPHTNIQFKAVPMDEAMHALGLKGIIKWKLSNDTLGIIDSDGTFYSNGEMGSLEVVASLDGTIIGSSILEIREPSRIEFENYSLQVNRDSHTLLSVRATYNNKSIVCKPHDFTYSIKGDIGTIDLKGIFHSVKRIASGILTATYGDLNTSIDVKVGQLPVDLENFEEGINHWTTSSVRAKSSTISLSTYPEPTRFGRHALKLSFDFTNQNGTSASYAAPIRGVHIPGYPKRIGMWVYGDNSGYMLRSILVSGNGNNIPLTFTENIDWYGWKYVDAEVPEGLQGPLMLHVKEVIRVIALENQNKIQSALFFDRIRAVYGETADDLTPPIVKDVYPKENETIYANVVQIKVTASDEGNHVSGIHYSKSNLLIDEIDYSHTLQFNEELNKMSFNDITLSDGLHTCQLIVEDYFGNVTEKRWKFKIDTKEYINE